MSSNYATSRLLGRLPSTIPLVEIADDIFAIREQDVTAARQLLADQPQILYFLDRNMRADEVLINDDGQRAWVLRHHDRGVATSLSTLGNATAKSVNVPAQPAFICKGFTVASQDTEVSAYGQYVSNPDILVCAIPRVMVSPRIFGPYPVGVSKSVYGPSPDARTFPECPNNQVNTVSDAQYDSLKSRVDHKFTRSVKMEPQIGNVDKPEYTMRTNLVMIAGPAVVDYAEIFPGFQWIAAEYGRVADRLEAVVNYMKQREPSIDDAKFREAILPMRAQSKAVMILFKGSVDFDPVEMWPLARQAVSAGFSAVPVDGVAVTAESHANGLLAWKTGRWCLTVSSGSVSDTELRTRLAKGDLTNIVLKPASRNTAHVGDGEGTVESSFDSLPRMVFAYREAGRTVTVVDSPFITKSDFDTVAWKRVTDALTGPIPEVVTGGVTITEGDVGGLGEAICVRLLTPPRFTPDEEAVVLPCLSPQYFWTDYARSAKVP